MAGHSPGYTITTDNFRNHIRTLYDSGYSTVSPAQLVAHLMANIPLPQNSILITFYDTHTEHYNIAAPILDSFGFKGIFFIMTVVVGKPGYMTTAQIKKLSDKEHVIGGHSYDHADFRKLSGIEWDKQISESNLKLQQITGKSVEYFAYPYGAWNNVAVEELKKRGLKAAFQLSGKQSSTAPLFTVRRLMVNGNWTGKRLLEKIQFWQISEAQ